MNCASCNTANPTEARFCIMCGERLQPAGSRERRRVSVVFIDLKAFTTLTLGFDPEELRDLADEVLTVVAGVIEDYDGYVDAFRGDGLIALFGAPRSRPDDPQRAVLASLAALRSIESIGRDRGYPLKGRAGVNTGIVIAGAVGSGRVRDYTVMGSTVNLAARLEAAAIPGEVWVGPDTYSATRHRLVYQPTPPISLAGFPGVRHAYRLVSPLEQYDHDPYGYLQFVGREPELGSLLQRFREARDENGVRRVALVGEPGAGKTRLLREASRKVAEEDGLPLWLAGAPAESSVWQQLARQLLDLHDGEDLRVRQQRVRQAMQNLLPGEESQHLLALASLGLAEEAPASRRSGRGRPAARLRAAAESPAPAWRDLLVACAHQRRGGILLAVDAKTHDRQVSELVAALEGAAAPILIVLTRRSPSEGAATAAADGISDSASEGAVGGEGAAGAAGGTGGAARVTRIELGPLPREGSVTLLGQLASPELRAASEGLIAQVGGNPAYIIELGRALSSTSSGTVSDSIASLLQARIDQLAAPERQMLAFAALTGERSWEGLILELSPGGEAELQRLLREGMLVTESDSEVPGQVAYRFQSELLRHAVLRMIPFGDRPVMHLRVATWLEQNAPLSLSATIAWHFAEADSAEAAYPHYLAAADLAMARANTRLAEDSHRQGEANAWQGEANGGLRANAAQEAIEHYRALLALELPAYQKAEGALAFVQALIDLGRPEQAREQLGRARAWVDQADAEPREELGQALQRLEASLGEFSAAADSSNNR